LKADIPFGGEKSPLSAISRHWLSVTRRTRESRIGSQLVMRDFSALSLFRIEMSGDDDCSSLRDESGEFHVSRSCFARLSPIDREGADKFSRGCVYRKAPAATIIECFGHVDPRLPEADFSYVRVRIG
jgi:hypothetical protein